MNIDGNFATQEKYQGKRKLQMNHGQDEQRLEDISSGNKDSTMGHLENNPFENGDKIEPLLPINHDNPSNGLQNISPYQQQLPSKVIENNGADHKNHPPKRPNIINHYNHVKIIQVNKNLNLHNSRGPKFDLKPNRPRQSGLKYNRPKRCNQSPQRTHVYGIARQTNG